MSCMCCYCVANVIVLIVSNIELIDEIQKYIYLILIESDRVIKYHY